MNRIEHLARAVYSARCGRHVIFVTRTPAQWLLGFLKQVAPPNRVVSSMRKAEYDRGSIIITDQIDDIRLRGTDRLVITDEDCPIGFYDTYLAEHKEDI